MHTLALLHLLAAQAAQTAQAHSGTLTVGESVALGVLLAFAGWVASVATTRSEVKELTRRVGAIELTVPTTTTAIARIDENLAGLRRELHASGAFPRAHRDAE